MAVGVLSSEAVQKVRKRNVLIWLREKYFAWKRRRKARLHVGENASNVLPFFAASSFIMAMNLEDASHFMSVKF